MAEGFRSRKFTHSPPIPVSPGIALKTSGFSLKLQLHLPMETKENAQPLYLRQVKQAWPSPERFQKNSYIFFTQNKHQMDLFQMKPTALARRDGRRGSRSRPTPHTGTQQQNCPIRPNRVICGHSPKLTAIDAQLHSDGQGAPRDPKERAFTRTTISGAAGKQIWETISTGNVKRGPGDAAGHEERWWGHASRGRSPGALGILPLPGYF